MQTVDGSVEPGREKRRAACRSYYNERKENPEFREKRNKRNSEWQKSNRKKMSEKFNRWRTTPLGWCKNTLARLRSRAKKKGIDFNITAEDLVFPELCPVLGIPLIIGSGTIGFHASPNAPSVDRFDNGKGYVKGNVRVISNRANLLKKDATLSEIENLAKYMRGES